MSQTKKGGETLKQHMVERFGTEEAYKEHMRSIASKGGKNSNNGGFASDIIGADGLSGKERAVVAGRKGGSTSRRRKNIK